MADAAKKEMKATVEAAFANFNKGDVESGLKGYTDNCVFMTSGADAIQGKPNVKAALTAGLKDLGQLKLTEIFYFEQINETTAYTNSYYNSCDGSGKVVAKLKDAVLWKKVGGKWLVDRDIFNPC